MLYTYVEAQGVRVSGVIGSEAELEVARAALAPHGLMLTDHYMTHYFAMQLHSYEEEIEDAIIQVTIGSFVGWTVKTRQEAGAAGVSAASGS